MKTLKDSSVVLETHLQFFFFFLFNAMTNTLSPVRKRHGSNREETWIILSVPPTLLIADAGLAARYLL